MRCHGSLRLIFDRHAVGPRHPRALEILKEVRPLHHSLTHSLARSPSLGCRKRGSVLATGSCVWIW